MSSLIVFLEWNILPTNFTKNESTGRWNTTRNTVAEMFELIGFSGRSYRRSLRENSIIKWVFAGFRRFIDFLYVLKWLYNKLMSDILLEIAIRDGSTIIPQSMNSCSWKFHSKLILPSKRNLKQKQYLHICTRFTILRNTPVLTHYRDDLSFRPSAFWNRKRKEKVCLICTPNTTADLHEYRVLPHLHASVMFSKNGPVL